MMCCKNVSMLQLVKRGGKKVKIRIKSVLARRAELARGCRNETERLQAGAQLGQDSSCLDINHAASRGG